MIWRKRLLWVVAALLLCIVGYRALAPGPASAEKFVTNLVGCLNERNASCLADSLSESELNAYGLERRQAVTLLNKYVVPTLPAGRTFVSQELTSGTGTRNIFFSIANDKTDWSISFDVRPIAGRLMCPSLLTTLVVAAGWQRHRAAAMPQRPAMRALTSMHEVATKDAQVLSGLGMHGIYRKPEEGLIGFDVWREMLEVRIAAANKGLQKLPAGRG